MGELHSSVDFFATLDALKSGALAVYFFKCAQMLGGVVNWGLILDGNRESAIGGDRGKVGNLETEVSHSVLAVVQRFIFEKEVVVV